MQDQYLSIHIPPCSDSDNRDLYFMRHLRAQFRGNFFQYDGKAPGICEQVRIFDQL